MQAILFREATISDIPQIQIVRNAVKENRLSDPNLITDESCAEYLTKRGNGWVCEIDESIIGFAIVDLLKNNIWALFVLPQFEGSGIGKELLSRMLLWYFDQTNKTVWLSTAPATRAEIFYKSQGWQESGIVNNGELKFEMSYKRWRKKLESSV